MRLTAVVLAVVLGLAGCTPVVVDAPSRPLPSGPRYDDGLPTPEVAAANFRDVIDRVEPVAEGYCRRARPNGRCDFQIAIARELDLPPNAFQTVDNAGRPVIGFTLSLIATARNKDELAFILGHEAAHHIAGHQERTQGDALKGAVLAGVLASVGGAGAGGVQQAQQVGAQLGARSFSKDYELEADALGTRIALQAGFDPVVGAQFFQRIPDPGNRFLGTHPANRDRIDLVRRTVADIRAGR